MKKVGGRAVVEYCIGFASEAKQSEDRRVRALAAIEGNFDHKNQVDSQRILALASADETPDKVRDLAFMRVGEMPREKVIGKLYELLGSAKRWQVRWVAAQVAAVLTPAARLALLLFQLLFIPCLATTATIKQETGSWRWMLASLGLLLALSYGAGVLVYQVAQRL